MVASTRMVVIRGLHLLANGTSRHILCQDTQTLLAMTRICQLSTIIATRWDVNGELLAT